jgi:hypothetical protein
MADLTFTTIEESARAELAISRDEYALCNYVQTWASHPQNRRPGWCNRTKEQTAAFVGITPRGVQLMLKKMQKIGLIERYSTTLFLHRITEKWFDTVTLAKQCRKGEESSPFGVKKVHPSGEESSPLRVKKVHPHKEFNNSPIKSGENAPTQPGAFVLQKKVETADEAEGLIMAWAEGEGRETVRSWYSNAYRKCTVADVKKMVQEFVHAYLTIGDAGKRERMERDPLQCFKYSFKVFLTRQAGFERQAEEKKTAQNGQNKEAIYESPVIPVFTSKSGN